MQASTFMAAPIMFISAKLLMVSNLDPSNYIDQIELFLLDIRLIAFDMIAVVYRLDMKFSLGYNFFLMFYDFRFSNFDTKIYQNVEFVFHKAWMNG